MSIDTTIAPVDTAIKNTTDLTRVGDVNGVNKPGTVTSEVGFGDTLKTASTNFVAVLNKAEATSIAGIKGDASTYEVASSVMEAERTLKMTIAVRDKIVAAYLEISRMQI